MWHPPYVRLEDLGPNERFQLFVENVRDYAFILLDCENHIVDWNVGAERMLGYTEAEALGQSGSLFFTPEDRESGEPQHEMATAAKEGRADDERWHMRKDGTRFRASGVMTPLKRDDGVILGFAKIMRDVTEREQARERLEATLREKHTLLLETHHRVKNNLEMIVSLLRLQAAHIDDAKVLAIFEETQNRVRAVARIHETLYSTADLATIHFGTYVEELVRELFAVHGTTTRIVYKVDAADMALAIEQAIPLALIVNELVTNSLMHAFPDGRNGRVKIGLYYESKATAPSADTLDSGDGILAVADDGIGLPAGEPQSSPPSMGFHLVNVLVRQLRGTISREASAKGTKWVVRFPLELG
jgi:PAS domain S-box-containing protein